MFKLLLGFLRDANLIAIGANLVGLIGLGDDLAAHKSSLFHLIVLLINIVAVIVLSIEVKRLRN